jgi:hypothetical protein
MEMPGQFVEHLVHIVEPPAVPEETGVALSACLGGKCGQSAVVPGVLVARAPRQRQTVVAMGGVPARDGPTVMRRRGSD